MRLLPLLAFALLVIGGALLVRGLSTEGGQAFLVLIFPVFVLEGPLSTLGAVFIVLAAVLGFLSYAGFASVRVGEIPREGRTSSPGAKVGSRSPKRRFGGVVLVGPVPIVFGSDARITVAMLILAIALTAVLLVLFL